MMNAQFDENSRPMLSQPCDEVFTPKMPLTFILGAPRSGTTWLSKIFDSHPSVMYQHEPDMASDATPLPVNYPEQDEIKYAALIREQVAAFLEVRNIKSAGSLPVFRKQCDTTLSYGSRALSIYFLHLLSKIPPRNLTKHCIVPGSPILQTYPRIHVVMKSVRLVHHAGLITRAIPDARTIVILRNPMGQVASLLNGITAGKFEMKRIDFDVRLLATPQARTYGLTRQRIAAMPQVEKFAWEWVVRNEKAIDDLDGNPRARIIRYDDLVNDPMGLSQDLFNFAGLDWPRETEAFVTRSMTPRGFNGYYTVYKHSRATSEKWREELSEQNIMIIKNALRLSKIGNRWPELIS
jgi:hypothetical protein